VIVVSELLVTILVVGQSKVIYRVYPRSIAVVLVLCVASTLSMSLLPFKTGGVSVYSLECRIAVRTTINIVWKEIREYRWRHYIST
jgi:hypothetical protein